MPEKETMASVASHYGERGDYGMAVAVYWPTFWLRLKTAFQVLFLGELHQIIVWKKPITEYPSVGITNGEIDVIFHWAPKEPEEVTPLPKTVWDLRREHL